MARRIGVIAPNSSKISVSGEEGGRRHVEIYLSEIVDIDPCAIGSLFLDFFPFLDSAWRCCRHDDR